MMGFPTSPSEYRLQHRPLSKQCHASSIAAAPVLPTLSEGLEPQFDDQPIFPLNLKLTIDNLRNLREVALSNINNAVSTLDLPRVNDIEVPIGVTVWHTAPKSVNN